MPPGDPVATADVRQAAVPAPVDLAVLLSGAAAAADRVEGRDIEITDIVVLVGEDVVAVANAFARRWPRRRIHVLGARRDLTEAESGELEPSVTHRLATSARARLDYLMRIPGPQLIVEAGNPKRMHKLTAFRDLFYFVAPGGCYLVAGLDSCGDPRVDDGAGENVLSLLSEVVRVGAADHAERTRLMVRELAAGTASTTFAGPQAAVDRGPVEYYLKVRDWEADEVLAARYGPAWGQTLECRPAREFQSRVEVTSHGEGPITSGGRTYAVPEQYLRRYSGAVCTARQIVRYGDIVLPDSWRHPHQRALNNRQLVHSSPYFGRYLDRTTPTTIRREAGSFCYLDTELPGHFGHITTDVLSRAWTWEAARREDPTVRALVSVSRPPLQVPGFQREIFTALGIGVDDALIIGPREAVEVETLYAGTPQLENPHYVDPDLARVWRRLADGLPLGVPATADRLFVSRRPSPKRHCAQTVEVERFFADEGFAVVFPEDHSYRDQVGMFARARVIAGFGGSGMFNTMFAPRATVILLSGSSYDAENELLIAAVNGTRLHYFWGPSQIPMPSRFSYTAFTSGWTFDLDRHRRALRRAIRG